MSHYEMPLLMAGAGRAAVVFEKALEASDLTGYHIDEIAYQFPDLHHFDAFTKEAVREDGCIMFNTADDHVHTLPMRTCYDVAYRFFTIPTKYLEEQHLGTGVRIEAMLPGWGLSPLHAAEAVKMVMADGNLAKASAIHASFKCVNEEQYAAVVHRLRVSGWEAAQRCESDYGRFSYWTPIDRDDARWADLPFMYLKPRVNTRDAA